MAVIGRLLAICVLLLTGWAPAAVEAGGETDHLDARVETPEYRLIPGGVEVPGYVTDTTPGAPRLPLYGMVFSLPLTGGWELTYQSVNSRVLAEQVTVAAAPTPNLDLNGPIAPQNLAALPSAVPVTDRPDPAIYGMNAFYPTSPVLAGEPVRQGDRHILPVRIFPFQYNPVTRQLRYHPDLRVTVEVQRGMEEMTPAAPPVGDFYQPTMLPGDGVLRVHTKERGLYRLTYNDLSAAGVPVGPGGVHPNTFAIYYKGQQIAIEVRGAGDGSFDQNDLVIFYAVPYDGGRFQNYNVYQFAYGGGIVGQRIATRPVTATTVPVTTSVITQTLHVENDSDYRSLYPRANHEDHFFDTQLYVNATAPTVTRSYDLALSNPMTSADKLVQIKALIHGGVNQAANPDQSVLLRLNSYDIGVYPWEGRTDRLISASVPAAWLDGSPNRVHLIASQSQLPSLSYYWISPDWIQVSYPAQAVAANDRLYIEGLVAPSGPVAVSGFTTPFVSAFDVRNPAQPLRLSGMGVQPDNGSYLFFWDETAAAPTYALSTDAALLTPGAVERDTPSNWANPNNTYDYIAIIGAQRFYTGTTTLGGQLAAAVQPLLSYRSSQGFNVAMVNVQDIYDEWSYGRIDPHAIRSFLSYAAYNWAATPNYVMLVGDGHYDYNKVTGQQLPLLVPPYLAYVDPWWGEVPTDNLFVSVDSLNDYLPDMAVGRLPVNRAADVAVMVDKILTYESVALNPNGLWQQRAVYVADDCRDSAGNFHTLSNQGRLQWLPTAYANDRVYYNPTNSSTCTDATHTIGTTLRPAVRAKFDQGALYLQWFGHGSQTNWGATPAFQHTDYFLLNQTSKMPFTTAYACLTGYFVWDSPFDSSGHPYTQSLAEIMVLTPQKSSIADLSPSGLHVGSALLTLQRGMHKKLFEERIERAGDVVDAAKWYFFQNSFGYHDVIDTMIFFGDPALKLRYPTGDLSSSTLEVSAAAALPGATLDYTLTIRNSSIFTTTRPSVVVDYPQHLAAVTAAGGGANNGDTLTWSLPDLPPSSQQSVTFTVQVNAAAAPDNFDLAMPATVSSQMAPSVALQALTVILTAPDAVASSLAGSRDWLPPGFPFTGTLSLSHADGLPAPSVQATMTLPAEFSAPTWLAASAGSPVYNPGSHTITWNGDVPAGSPTTLAFRSVISSSLTLSATLPVSATVTYRGSTTSQAIAVGLAVPDVNGSGAVTVADIQEVAARWVSLAGSGSYHPRYDLNADDAIDVLDIIIAAEAWN